jgi:hypothetical protein
LCRPSQVVRLVLQGQGPAAGGLLLCGDLNAKPHFLEFQLLRSRELLPGLQAF